MRIINTRERERAFTLIELVITMVMVGILFGVVGGFIGQSMVAYTSVTRRGQLVDAADMALRRMARDVQGSLPNSIRVKAGAGSDAALEFVHVVESIRYRAQGSDPNTVLNFNAPDTNFDVMGLFQLASLGVQPYRLVIYNTGAISGGSFDNPVAGENVYNPTTAPGPFPPAGTHVINTAGQTITLSSGGGNGHVNISAPGMQFAFPSPQQKLYIIDSPVTYLCSPSPTGGTIFRYSGYALQAIQPVNSAVAPLSTATSIAQLTGNVTACSFTYTQGTPQRNAVLTMSISVAQAGETITLMREVSVDNTP